MPLELASLADLAHLPRDDIIDVRSPAEFAEDHLPDALSLPVLSNDERARVGTIYVQQDRFLARKIGAAMVSRNTAAHLEGPLADKPGSWRAIIYCWRGGQRSGSFASILREIGWRVDTIAGGYKSYRRLVVRALYEDPMPCPVILIDGGTGTAKTRLLHHLQDQGAQVLDLEAMAQHRGSLFGPVGDAQPSQKAFESRLAMAMTGLDPARPVFVEAESSRIGRITLPPAIWAAMRAARRLHLAAPLAARAGHLVAAYADLVARPDRLDHVLDQLIRYHGHAQVDEWKALAGAGAFHALCESLIARHYDPRYARRSERSGPDPDRFDLPDLSDETLAATAARILAR